VSNMERRLYCYPRYDGTNEYLRCCERIWNKCGYLVYPLPRIRSLIKSILNRESILILNWMEDNVAGNKSGFIKLCKLIVTAIVLRISFRRIIWVRHNYKPHLSYNRYFYWIAIKVLNLISDDIVTHRPVTNIKSRYIPHPLYTEFYENLNGERDIEFLLFGAVKPYKKIDILLESWPTNESLLIAGYCNDQGLEDRIRNIIHSRQLKVTWINEFLTYEALCGLIKRAKFTVLSHQDESMIVSGAFYHAISYGSNILTIENAFYYEYISQYDFVKSFDYQNLPQIIQQLSDAWIPVNFIENLSDKSIRKEWLDVLIKDQSDIGT